MKSRGFHREAEAEYAEAAEYYAQVSPALGARFYEEIELLIADVCIRPQVYRRQLGEVRRHVTTDFPYGILYEDQPERYASWR